MSVREMRIWSEMEKAIMSHDRDITIDGIYPWRSDNTAKAEATSFEHLKVLHFSQ